MGLTVNTSWFAGHLVNRHQWALKEFSRLLSHQAAENIRAHKQTTGTFKIGDKQRNTVQTKTVVKGFVSCFLLVFNDFGALTARVQSFWGLIWHWSDVWPCCDKYCRSKCGRNWPTCILFCPKSSVDRIRRHNEGWLEVQLCESDASVNVNQRDGKPDIKAFWSKSSEAKCWTKYGVGKN